MYFTFLPACVFWVDAYYSNTFYLAEVFNQALAVQMFVELSGLSAQPAVVAACILAKHTSEKKTYVMKWT